MSPPEFWTLASDNEKRWVWVPPFSVLHGLTAVSVIDERRQASGAIGFSREVGSLQASHYKPFSATLTIQMRARVSIYVRVQSGLQGAMDRRNLNKFSVLVFFLDYNINCVILLSDIAIYCMKTQLDELLQSSYHALLWRIKIRLLEHFGSQVKVAKLLSIDPANLSKILSGVIDCNSKLFFRLLSLAGMVVIVNDMNLDHD